MRQDDAQREREITSDNARPSPGESSAGSSGVGPAPPVGHRSPLAMLMRLFSSVRLGIVLLSVLFVYMTIGSAGLFYAWYDPGGVGFFVDTYMLRQHRL